MLRLKGNRKTRRYLKKVLRRVSNTRLNKLIKSPKTFANFLSKFGLILTFSSNIAFANPEGGIVVEGDASITTPSENYMQIDQSSQKAIIDWQDFSIDVEEHTHFEQPNSSSTTLNRVVTNLPSEIFGKLSGTGKVMLINQNGIFFGEGAQVDLNGLVASSADISNQDFLDGNYNFNISGSPDAEIKNDGQINISDGGVVALVAPKVSNNGFINAKLGKITLAATDKWILDAGGMVKMVVDEDIVVQLVQSGHIQADGGMIQLSAAAVQGMLSTVVNVSGVTRAQSASVDNSGNIILYAGDSAGNVGGTIEVTGTLDVSGDGIGETGGAIHIAAERISVSDGANIDASGYSGGGEVLIGGDYKGGDYRGTLDINDDGRGGTSSVNQTKVSEAMEAFYYSIMGIPTASKVYMGFDTSIDVSADYQGNAGRTILWADDLTKYYGTIIARGGQLSGDGGFIETSGGILEAAGFVDTVALNGVNGTWLLDPYNITITSADNNTSNDGGSPNTFSASGTSATIDSATLVTALEGGNNVVVTTAGGGAEDGDITVTSDISSSSINSDVSLSLEAHRNIDINGGVDISAAGSSNKLDITLNADTDAMGGGAIIIGDGATDTILNSNGGDIVIGGGADPSTTAAIGNTDGSTDIGVHVDQAQILAGDGNISIIGEGEGTNDNNYGVYIEGGSTIKTTYTGASTTQGNIDITGTGGDGGATNRGVYINGGSTTITVVDGDININGTGGTQTGNDSDGIRINTSTVSSTGTGTNAGTITLIGASGDSASQSDGINIRGTVTSEDGDITITGTSPGTYSGNRNIGVYLDFEANVESTGTTADAADITITGTGGDAGGNGNNGFRLYGSSDAKVTTIAGDISITGTGDGAGTNNDGVRIHSTATGSIASTGSGNITLEGSEVGSGSGEGIYFESGNTATVGDATMTGDITFIADTINIEAGTIKTTGNYILQTKTAGTDINISNTTTGGLDLSTTELAFFDQTINSGWGLYAHDNILIDDDADLTSAASEAGGFSLYADTDSTGSGTITLGDGTGSTDIGNSTHTGDITLQADNLIMNAASLDTDGSFILKTRTADTDINISNTTTGGFDLSLTELAFFDQTDNTGWNLVAHGDILIDDGADLTTQSGGLGIVINSDSDETSGGAIRIGDNGGDFSVLTSNGSDITLGGGADPTTTAAIGSTDGTYDIGVNFDEAKILSGDGNITIIGEGDSSNSDNYGVYIGNDSVVQTTYAGASTTEGNIKITGTGGAGAFSNTAVRIVGNSQITTDDGDITITGTGGASTDWDNEGILIDGGSDIISTGGGDDAGNITLVGTGGTGVNRNQGLFINGASTSITTVDGDIYIKGTGTGTGAASHGILLWSGLDTGILSSGLGNITLEGIESTNSEGIVFEPGNSLTIGGSSMKGDITLLADLVALDAGTLDTDGSFIIKTRTADTDINITNSFTSGVWIPLSQFAFFDQTDNTGWNLVAHGDILIEDGADLTTQSGGLGIVINSDFDETNGGAIRIGDNGGDFSVLTSNGSNITLGGGADPTTTAAIGSTDGTYDIGVNLDEAKILSGDGNITIIGEGEGTNDDNYGIYIQNGSKIQTTYTGALTTQGNIDLTGTGGDGGLNNRGVYILNSGSIITVVDGDIDITGTGGDQTGIDSSGVRLQIGTISSTGTGSNAGEITVTGNTGNSTSNSEGVIIRDALVTSVDGDITLTGTSPSTYSGTGNNGVRIQFAGVVSSTGATADAANITITGTAGNGTNNNFGLRTSDSGSKVTTIVGDISITGTGNGSGSNNSGIYLEGNLDEGILSTGVGNITLEGIEGTGGQGIYFEAGNTATIGGSSMTGDITLTADTVDLSALSVRTTGNTTVQTENDSTTMGLGDSSTGTLNLTDTELGFFHTDIDTLTFGNGTVDGATDVRAATWNSNVVFQTDSGVITFNGDQNAGTNDITITSNALTALNSAVTFTGGIVTLDTLDADSNTLNVNADSLITQTIANVGDTTFTVDALDLAGALSGQGAGDAFVLEGKTNSTTIGIGTGATGDLQLADAEVTNIGSGWDSVTLGKSTGTGAMQVNAATWADDVSFLSDSGVITFNGDQNAGTNDITITSNATSELATDTTFTGAAVTLDALDANSNNLVVAAASLIAQTIANVADVTLTVDALDLAGALSGQGAGDAFVLEGKTNSTTIGIGTGATGDLQLTDAEVTNIGTGWDSVTLGKSTGTGAMQVNAATWADDVSFLSDSGVITFNGDQNAGTNDITITSNALTALNSAVTFTGGIVTLDTLDADSNTLNVNADSLITQTIANVGDTTFTVDALDLAGALSGQGAGDAFVLEGKTNSTTIGIGTGATGDLQLTDGEITNIGTGWDSVTLGKSTGTGAMQVNAATWADDVSFLSDTGVITFNGDQNAGSNDITITSNALTALNSAVTFTGGIVTLDTLDADSNTLNVNADSLITQTIANVGDTTFTVDALDLAGALSGQGAGDAFVLEGKTNSTTIGIGTGATGDLQLTDAEVTNIGTGWDSVTLGKSTGTGAMQVNAATWADDIILRTDSGIITLLGAQTFNNNDFTVNTSASFDTVANITDGGDVNITAGSITGGDNITATSLTTNTTGDTTIGDISLGAGTLDINADNLIIGDVTSGTTTIDSKGNLTIGAFTPASATVTFDSDNTGSATANISSIVGGLTIDGGSSVGNVLNVTGTISAGAEDLDFTAETINLQDDVAANKVDISGKDITATGTITAPTINFVNTGTIIADIVSTAVDISGIKTTLTGTVDGGVDQAAANKINKITTPSIDSEYIFNTFIIGATASPPAPAPTPSPTPSPSPDPTPSPSPTPSVPSLESSLNYDIEKIKQYPIKIEEFDSITYKTKKVTNLESDYFNSIPTIEKVDGQALKELMLQQEGLVTNPKFGIQNEVNSQNDNIDDEVDE